MAESLMTISLFASLKGDTSAALTRRESAFSASCTWHTDGPRANRAASSHQGSGRC